MYGSYHVYVRNAGIIVKFFSVFLAITLLFAGLPAVQANLPLPRFVSIKSGEANVRTGPGMEYPIQWIYVKPGLPVEIVAEYEQWRRIRDIQGDEGWVHRALLSGRRTVIVTRSNQRLLKSPRDDGTALASIEQGVVADVMDCKEFYCRVKADTYRGWISKQSLWGVYPAETID